MSSFAADRCGQRSAAVLAWTPVQAATTITGRNARMVCPVTFSTALEATAASHPT